MRVLITGAAGFLGRRFVAAHLAAGDTVVGIDDLSSEGSFWPHALPAMDRLEMDAGRYFAAEHTQAVAYDLAYHFAAPVGGRLKIEGDPLYNADSLRLDSLFFRWASKGNVKQCVYPSSSAVYGVRMQGQDGICLHEAMFRPNDPTWQAPDEMYGFTKLAGEVLAWKAAKYGVNTLCIRPFSGYGEGQSFDYPVPSIARRALLREDPLVIWGSGTQTRDFIHVDDLVAATMKAAASGTTGYWAMNIASGRETSFLSVARLCAEIVGYTPRIVTDETKPEGVSRRYGDASTMLKYHTPEVGLREGLERVIAWIDR